ncbi:DUF92 domain-containing protein [Natrialbaceae archaeon AArc-T1-2]|uniref:DUF92 domain-containing protein n=1 Tax=Natrialbaceae archaeon AArc-T1-2 TaxID=3053904 RepID=UPI00255AD80B|nr:DUF92 domain-containing protein [Natrialbaceae archaeon AArc-T1-2]WIV68001.1 DUF92 domain-containing protein [Natrialbaceae archaeon AArc-T1-2]
MTSAVRRAGAFAALCTLSLAVPLLGPAVAIPIPVVVLLGALVVTDGPLFDLFAYPDDYEDGRLYGLMAFVLAATALGVVAVMSSMTIAAFVGAVMLVGYGNLAARLARRRADDPSVSVGAFCLAGGLAAVVGQALALALAGEAVGAAAATIVFLAASGALLASILREVLILYDAPVIMLVVGLVLWLLIELEPAVGSLEVVVALAVTGAFGYVSYVLGAASIAGMFTGVLLGLLTIVFGGYDWFVVLLSFFAIGSLSTKYRYEEKKARGIAEANDGARGSANVLGNAAVSLAAVIGYAASTAGLLALEADVFLFAFAGSVATAMSDTLSSEIGGVFDRPRLITTFERVEPGTDGGVTWQGELAGIAGATIVAALSFAFFPEVDAVGAAVIVAAGVVGMTVDSLLGATLEGTVLGNQGVNFLATLSGALVGAVLVFSVAAVG